MMNIGERPTVTSKSSVSIEVNLFDFEGDLYNQQITVQLLSRFRDEIRFDSIDELKEQLNKDEMRHSLLFFCSRVAHRYSLKLPLRGRLSWMRVKVYTWEEAKSADPDTIYGISLSKFET